MSPTNRSRLLESLASVTRAHPHARKRLVGPDINYGRELLAALARHTGGWIGWEATTLRGLAEDLAFVALHERGWRAGSDVEIGALVNQALDRAIAAGRLSPRFAALERSLGFRHALRDALLELRIAGTAPAALAGGAHAQSPAADLAPVLAEYEALLAASGLADPAAVFHAASEAFEREAPFTLDGETFLAPMLSARGLPAALVERLVARGARRLESDDVLGLARPACFAAGAAARGDDRAAVRAPLSWLWSPADLPGEGEARVALGAAPIDLFAAATPAEELREALRRAIAEGVRWDDVEIVTTDPDAYGIALDALCQRIGAGATMLHGVPLARTRLGRALDRWLAWLDDGLPADLLRHALEAGELSAPGAEVPPTVIARELRRQRIGWGRARYESALAALSHGAPDPARRDDEPDEAYAARAAAARRSAGALVALLRAILAATPRVPERGSDLPVRTTTAALARATLAWLDLVPVHGEPEQHTVSRLRTRLGELAAVADAESGFSSALAAMREALADLRAWPMVTSDRKPWSTSGGMVHLTDVAHAGTTGRPRIFVVGLDAERTAAPRVQDPFLGDTARRAIGSGALATTVERREESAWRLASALAGLRGRVTLSYATSGTLDVREAGPAPALLQAWRLTTRDPSASYETLRRALGAPASPVPARRECGAFAGIERLDARDVWLDALAEGALLLDGDAAVRGSFPMLDRGLRALDAAAGAEATPHHGIVPRAAGALDPSLEPRRPVSPSSLETLAACPLRWFYRNGLALHPPDDPEYDAARWLNEANRGSLLHEVYEAFVKAYAGRQEEIVTAGALDAIREIATTAIARWRELVPPPGEAVFEMESAELRAAALAFLEMERELHGRGERARWLHPEYAFGRDGPPGLYELGGGIAIAVRGIVDRVDELPDGTLRVIDYKTGRPSRYARGRKHGPFNGGRNLQPALYSAAVAQLMQREVSRFEYRFPTARGGNEIVPYDSAELHEVRELLDEMLGHVRDGTFVPTTDSGDCTFCDYLDPCRATRTRSYGRTETHSPRAEWAAEHAESLEVYTLMLGRRGRGPA